MRNVIATASAIHSVCVSMSSIAAQTAGGTPMVSQRRISTHIGHRRAGLRPARAARVHEDPGALLEAGDDADAGEDVDVPVELARARSGGRCDDHVVRRVAEMRCERAPSASRSVPRRHRRRPRVVASSKRAPGRAVRRRACRTGRRRGERAPGRRRPSTTTSSSRRASASSRATRSAVVRSGARRPRRRAARGRARRAGREGARSTRPRSRLVHERLHVGATGGEVVANPVAHHRQHLESPRRRRASANERRVIGREDHDLVRAGVVDPVAAVRPSDDRDRGSARPAPAIPGVSGSPSPVRCTSGGVIVSWPAQNGQSCGSLPRVVGRRDGERAARLARPRRSPPRPLIAS